MWLQQDFNIFVVGLFDTYHASKVLDFQKHGLANLLEAFCDFIPDKRYQLADWRIRYVKFSYFFSIAFWWSIILLTSNIWRLPME